MELKPFESKVWLSSPTMHGEELEYVKEAYETNWMSTVGANINESEKGVCEKVGCKYAVALACGTAALHMAVKLAGVKQGDKVFCSDMTFDATVNPVVYAERIQKWFDRFENALKQLLDDETIQLKYNYKEYEFQIIEQGKEAYGFDQLSDGYSSLIHMVSDLILRMDKNWILTEGLSEYNVEGIVLIDELETHLHIELQKKILPFLTEFFPRIQFIVTTHSPYILNSIQNAKAYDLEKHIVLEHLSAYSSEDLAEAYFDTDEYSEVLKEKLIKYSELVEREDLTDDERAVRAELKSELSHLSNDMSMDVKILFDEIERRRKSHG